MKRPRITGHQHYLIICMKRFEDNTDHAFYDKISPRSWLNAKGQRVWSFTGGTRSDPYDCKSGESMLKKGLIEPWYTMKHDGSYKNWPDAECQVYKLSELGRSYLN